MAPPYSRYHDASFQLNLKLTFFSKTPEHEEPGSDRIFGSVRFGSVIRCFFGGSVRFGSVENFDRTTEFFVQKMARNQAFSAMIFQLFNEKFYGFHGKSVYLLKGDPKFPGISGQVV
eukprot:sb/3476498/